ncbi:unnamed protein product [Ostreobium quekettii]|uniref:tRNA-binding domain-containing protein n=1 Tax=Ostreobium quekettii TaxID=121088 RepID=A0A8S1IK92_9CHLO|nr:unnamed protein product [Ostreobium quekettii]
MALLSRLPRAAVAARGLTLHSIAAFRGRFPGPDSTLLSVASRISALPFEANFAQGFPALCFEANLAKWISSNVSETITPGGSDASPAAGQSSQAVRGKARPPWSRYTRFGERLKTNIDALDIRVGEITGADAHPRSEELVVQEVGVGEGETRTVVSRFGRIFGKEDLVGRRVVVLCNTKMRKMLGVMSNGLILCARDAALDIVQLLEPPQRAVVGERVQFGSRVIKQGRPVTPTTASRWKLWSEMQPLLKTGPDGAVAYNGQIMYTKAGPVKAPKVIKGSVTALVWRELKPEEAEAHAQRLQQSARAASNEPAPAVL